MLSRSHSAGAAGFSKSSTPTDNLFADVPLKRQPTWTQKTQSSKHEMSINICARLKPLLSAEEKETVTGDSLRIVDLNDSVRDGVFRVGTASEDGTIKISQKIPGYQGVILPDSDQAAAYTQVVPKLLYTFLNGNNCTLFVYGQTGSGKTHTLFGPPCCFTSGALSCGPAIVPESWGMFPRCAFDLLSVLRADGPSAVLNVSVVEIYLNICYDLLNEKKVVPVAGFGKGCKSTSQSLESFMNVNRRKGGKWICPFKDGKWNTEGLGMDRGYEASGQRVEQIRSMDDILRIAATIDASRSAKSHNLNERSSRSHCVITLTVGGSGQGQQQLSSAKFLLVDLAGSERIAKSGVTGEREAEAKNVNTSLSALGRCIQSLGRREKFVPFRDSVLTMLMKQSLGGNCFTSVVVTVCEDPAQIQETVSSLSFGRTCSLVKNKADSSANVIADRGKEVRRLQEALAGVNVELGRLEREGKAGGLNMAHNKATRDMFVDNKQRLDEHSKQLRAVKMSIADMRAAGKDEAGCAEWVQAVKKRDYAARVVNVQKGILIRMMMSGLFLQPTKGYLYRLAEKRRLVASLAQLGEEVDGDGDADALTMGDLFLDFIP
eukprot:CAMPEP_0181293290 /NCGR_PEP_ID=MMETSP1101-20121128/2986_1 /TAXON_ID=46948 /ORGANISM="Rhodomonas abbreviata, Strain Caron Lab Isolate" /LENGTH=603 /DNA_ID=CAMNT_0023397867 /DNA_START=181 /DNA_END=1992 /DNA_ORIENTATION=-